jgi:hypothetical protein
MVPPRRLGMEPSLFSMYRQGMPAIQNSLWPLAVDDGDLKGLRSKRGSFLKRVKVRDWPGANPRGCAAGLYSLALPEPPPFLIAATRGESRPQRVTIPFAEGASACEPARHGDGLRPRIAGWR